MTSRLLRLTENVGDNSAYPAQLLASIWRRSGVGDEQLSQGPGRLTAAGSQVACIAIRPFDLSLPHRQADAVVERRAGAPSPSRASAAALSSRKGLLPCFHFRPVPSTLPEALVMPTRVA